MDPSLCRALGPLWLLGFSGPEPPDAFLRLLERYRPQSIILFRDNLPAGSRSLRVLHNRLQEAADGPLALFLDEEGGWIQQLGERAWPSPRAQALAGVEAGEACVIERLPERAEPHEDPAVVANHWRSPWLKGRARGQNSHGRAAALAMLHLTVPSDFSWLQAPVLNSDTRLAVIANAAAGSLQVQGFEASGVVTSVFSLPQAAMAN